jgi:TolA-binding protein
MGLIEYNNKRYTGAYKYFEKVVNLYPFGYDALLMFAWANFQLGKTREAKVLFQKVILISPGDKSALEGLSLIK